MPNKNKNKKVATQLKKVNPVSTRPVVNSTMSLSRTRGHGNYITETVWPAIKKHGGALLKAAGRAALTHLAKTVTGHGEYNYRGNVSTDRVGVSFGDPTVEVCHSEFVGDLTGTTSFSKTDYKINPTNANLFPWLASVARNYQTWELSGMVVEYRATSASALNSTNTALGTVLFACETDVDASGFTNKFQMENYQGSISAPPDRNIYFGVECARRVNPATKLYTDVSSDDDRLSYLGRLSVATVGMQASATIGELWVHYKIKLMQPRISTISTAGDVLVVSGNGTTVVPGLSFGSSPSVIGRGKFDGTWVDGNAVNIPHRLSPGVYLVIEQISASGAVGSVPTPGLSIAGSLVDGSFFAVHSSTASTVWGFMTVKDTSSGTTGVGDVCQILTNNTGYTSDENNLHVMYVVALSNSTNSNDLNVSRYEGIVQEVLRRLAKPAVPSLPLSCPHNTPILDSEYSIVGDSNLLQHLAALVGKR